jgi:hypothetical protein
MVSNPGVGEPIGEFEVTSGKLFVTDPCYERGTWCAGTLDNVSKGTWQAYAVMGDRGNRVMQLSIRKKGTRGDIGAWNKENIDVGVDSGQAGFFDVDHYPASKDVQGEYGEEDTFYGKCCKITLDENGVGGGTLEHGVVSSSGWGDGSYFCYTFRNKAGELVAAAIDFGMEEEEEEKEPCCWQCGRTTGNLDDDGYCERCTPDAETCDECGEEKDLEELDSDSICDDCREKDEDKDE